MSRGLEVWLWVPNGGEPVVVEGGENGDGMKACDSGDGLEGDSSQGSWLKGVLRKDLEEETYAGDSVSFGVGAREVGEGRALDSRGHEGLVGGRRVHGKGRGGKDVSSVLSMRAEKEPRDNMTHVVIRLGARLAPCTEHIPAREGRVPVRDQQRTKASNIPRPIHETRSRWQFTLQAAVRIKPLEIDLVALASSHDWRRLEARRAHPRIQSCIGDPVGAQAAHGEAAVQGMRCFVSQERKTFW
ncbi:hypothetical protein C8R44DRAFT_723759 [Mycena epipterygia]|nr:hypothetical protein C8R44DRAFT_723759 [Mycena epipterygia]